MDKSLKYFVFLFSLLFCISSANAKLFDGSEFYLDNGLRVIVIENHKAPIVKHMIWYKAGAVDDLLAKAGTAHLLEHLMFRGTDKVRDFNKVVSNNGGDANAFTSYDFTAYHETVDVSRLELVMYLEADRMRNVKFDGSVFDKERDVVFQERKQVVESNPYSKFMEAFRQYQWRGSNYARPVIGSDEEILSLKIEDVKRFYERFYAPNNAVLIISGDVDVKIARDLAEKYYGHLQKREVARDLEKPARDNKTNTKFVMVEPRINVSRGYLAYSAPSFAIEKEKIYPLIVLADYIGGGETSKLYKELVLNKKLAVDVSASYSYADLGFGDFTVYAVPLEGVDVEKLFNAVREVMDRSVLSLNEKELEKVKSKIKANLIYLKDNPSDAAYIVGKMASVGMGFEEIQKYADELDKVSVSDVKEAYKYLKEKASSVEGYLVPEEGGR